LRREGLSVREAIVVIAFSGVCAFAPVALALAPRAGEPMAVIAPPWSAASASSIVAAAHGFLLDAADHHVAIGIDPSPGFASRLYGAGAFLVLDGRAAALCSRFASRTASSQPERTP
jgi:hypothetical protein